MTVLFVAGAGTDVGKTYVTAALVRRLRAEERSVLALKPVASGVPDLADPGFLASDTGVLLAAQGLAIDAEAVEACTPWRFAAPLSPDMAARREGRELKLADLVAFHRRAVAKLGPDAVVLVEGAGGLMSPVTADATGLDWLKALDCPAVLVTGSYLGAISHALTACETLARHKVPLAAVVVSESLGAPTLPDEVAAAIVRFSTASVVTLHRGDGFDEGLSWCGPLTTAA